MNTDLRPILVGLVPRAWTPEQALRAVQLLQQVVAAIWCVHGEAMGRVALGEPARREEPPPTRKPTGR